MTTNEVAPTPFGTVLVANRGEIAVRIIRAAADAGLRSVAVFADQDAGAPHARMADVAVALGGSTAAATYLDPDKLVAAAREAGADAVHPGYGFLSEDAGFAQAVVDAGLIWIGPPAQVIRDLGDKVSARRIAQQVGAPLVPGTTSAVSGPAEVEDFARTHGLPVAIKAAFGGGGRGLRVVRSLDEIPAALDAATREAQGAFGRGECFVERYLDRPRHVEAQVLADQHGKVVVVGTRDCSLQRRHQKLVEEAPAPFLTAEQRDRIHTSARAICHAAGYRGAGTVEYLVGRDGTVSFLEVNTRLQVEHPVTEETAGVDLVREMFRIAAGEPLSWTDPEARGHSIEFRINAEDAAHGFVPTPGRVTGLTWPAGPGVRVDAGVEAGSVVDGTFDSLLAKVIVTGTDRADAIERSRRVLDELEVEGITTVVPFHRLVVRDPAFAGGADDFAVHTRWIETDFVNPLGDAGEDAGGADDVLVVEVGGRRLQVRVPALASLGAAAETIRAAGAPRAAGTEPLGDAVTAPMQGTIVKVLVTEGQTVEAGDPIAVLEAMKMENTVVAHKAGTVFALAVAAGDGVRRAAPLCELRTGPDTTGSEGRGEDGV